MFRTAVVTFILFVSVISGPTAEALAGRGGRGGNSNQQQTSTFRLGYLLGVNSLAQYDQVAAQYPAAVSSATMIFSSNGTVQVTDNTNLQTLPGTWVKQGNSKRVVTVPTPNGPAVYRMFRVSGANWYGEVYFNNILYGFFRGSF